MKSNSSIKTVVAVRGVQVQHYSLLLWTFQDKQCQSPVPNY